MSFFKNKRLDIALILLLVILISFIWCFIYRRFSLNGWMTPISYSWDDWQTLTNIAVYWKNEALPILSKNIAHLNAPFSANWDDWPFGDDLLFFPIGQLAKLTGLFMAANISIMIAHVLAGVSFYISARLFKIGPYLAFIGGLCFGLSNYAFTRSLQHIVLVYYWHLPLLCVITWWIHKNELKNWQKCQIRFALVLSFLCGFFYVYYTYVFLQFLFWALLYHWVNKNKGTCKFIIILMALSFSSTLLMQLDTLFYRVANGTNSATIARSLWDVEMYALKIPDLILPQFHRINFIEQFTNKIYFKQFLAITSERPYSYLGFIGVMAFIFVNFHLTYSILKKRLEKIHVFTWYIIWLILFSIAGGYNLLISSVTSFNVFRCTNRYSILILALCLLLFLKYIQRNFKNHKLIAVILFLLIMMDLPKRVSKESYETISKIIQSDKALVEKVESYFPNEKVMVFQLPVVEYPETPAIHKLQDYEHFRLYYFSKNLHFSYGGAKGREREAWQKSIEKKSALEMITELREKGFKLLYINRKGYSDNARQLEHELSGLGLGEPATSDLQDIAIYKI